MIMEFTCGYFTQADVSAANCLHGLSLHKCVFELIGTSVAT